MSDGLAAAALDMVERPLWTLATKTELDTIADELTVAENRLLVAQSDGQYSSLQPSLYEKLSSQHRTVIFGRYSSRGMSIYGIAWTEFQDLYVT